jgi:hypothetical protein
MRSIAFPNPVRRFYQIKPNHRYVRFYASRPRVRAGDHDFKSKHGAVYVYESNTQRCDTTQF